MGILSSRTLERKEALVKVLALENKIATRHSRHTQMRKNPLGVPETNQDSEILPNKEGGYAPQIIYIRMMVAVESKEKKIHRIRTLFCA